MSRTEGPKTPKKPKKTKKNAQRNENLAELKAKFKNISKSAADLPFTFGYF